MKIIYSVRVDDRVRIGLTWVAKSRGQSVGDTLMDLVREEVLRIESKTGNKLSIVSKIDGSGRA